MNTVYTGKRYDYGKGKHGTRLAWALERYDHSVLAKKEVEREGLLATKHLSSFLDESKHPWSTKVYDPVFHGALEARRAKVADAFFANPPLYGFDPDEHTTWEQAQAMARACEMHERAVVSDTRQGVLQGFSGQSAVGTQAWAVPWMFRQGKVGRWQETDLRASFVDPVTGLRQHVTVPGAGPPKRVRELVTLQDGPMCIPKHITQWGCDTSNSDHQKGEWFYERDTISDREARQRVEEDNWDSKGVELAIKGEMPEGSATGMREAMDWFEEIGLNVQTLKNGMFGQTRKVVEVIELYYRERFSVRRMVILNRAYIVWDDVSPYDHGLFPYLVTRNYSLLGQFWGLSDYRISRYLIRGIQQMRNAVVNEASWRANPPMLYPDTMSVQMRYEPRAHIPVKGDPMMIRFLEGAGQALGDASAVAEMMQQRMDAGLGSNEQARGGAGKSGVTATAVQQAFAGAGLRDKLLIDDFADRMVVPMADMKQQLVQQYGDRRIWYRSGPQADPVEVWPEDYRGGCYRPTPICSTDPLRQIQVKRLLDLYNLAAQHQEPHVKRDKLVEGLLEEMAPDLKERVFKSEDEIKAEQQEQQAQQQGMGQPRPQQPMLGLGGPGGGQRTGEYRSPFPSGGPQEMGAMMAEAM